MTETRAARTVPPPPAPAAGRQALAFAIPFAAVNVIALATVNPVLANGGEVGAVRFLAVAYLVAWALFFGQLGWRLARRPPHRASISAWCVVCGFGLLGWNLLAGLILDPGLGDHLAGRDPSWAWKLPALALALAGVCWATARSLLRFLPQAVCGLSVRPRTPLLVGLLLLIYTWWPLPIRQSESASPAELAAAASASPYRVLLFGVDGADWRTIDDLVASGRLPHLQRLRAEGASGPLETLKAGNATSPVIWTTVATGRLPKDHGVVWMFEYYHPGSGLRIPRLLGNVLERLQLAALVRRPIPQVAWRARPVWDVLSELGRSVLVANWWFTNPPLPVNGIVISDSADDLTWTGCDSEPPAEAASGVPAHHPPDLRLDGVPGLCERVRVLGERVEAFLGGLTLATAQREVDAARNDPLALSKLNTLDTVLAVNEAREELQLRAFEHLWAAGDFDFAAYLITRIDQNSHHYTKRVFGPPEDGVYPLVVPEEVRAALWRDVVASAYDRVDAALGALMATADERTVIAVVSDHGWSYDGSEHGHFPPGIVILWGAPIRAGVEIEGASVFDVAPTVLRLLGAPLSERLPGGPLDAAFADAAGARPPGRVASYGPPDPAGTAPFDAEAANTHVERLRALGYIR